MALPWVMIGTLRIPHKHYKSSIGSVHGILVLIAYLLSHSCNSVTCWVIFHAFLSSADFFQNQSSQNILSGISLECQTVWVQTKPVVPDLGTNCLQRLSVDATKRARNLFLFCFHMLCWQADKALARLPICLDSPWPPLVAYARSIGASHKPLE